MAKEYEILQQALKIAEQAWIKWDVEKAIQAVASHPHVGQVEQGIYIGRQPASNGTDQVVDLTATGDGAARLAQDPTVRCIFLQRNPNIRGFEDATCLTIDREGDRFRLICRAGQLSQQLDPYRARLVNNVIGNIVSGLA